MMHVQLINESQYNKEHKIKIHSLCFYYRNHKHVLYGAFTINDEVFIFSFNIFDIYRSYNSKSNKKSSKAHKNGNPGGASKSQAVKANAPITAQTILNLHHEAQISQLPNNLSTYIQLASKFKDLSDSTKMFDASMQKTLVEEVNQSNQSTNPTGSSINSNNNEFTNYINEIIKSKIDEQLENLEQTETVKFEDKLSEIKDKPMPEPPPPPPPPPQTNEFKPSKNTILSMMKLKETYDSLNHKLKESLYPEQDNKSILNSQLLKNPGGLSGLSQKNLMNLTSLHNATLGKQANPLNLSNYLVVRFEICPSNQESSSKSKGKYKKSIKIVSVSSKPLNISDMSIHFSNNDIQLKAYEFTEKCLSFRLASVDLSGEPLKRDFDVKLINLYERYLCALVNYKTDEGASFKLLRIKHEETSSVVGPNGGNGANSAAESKIKEKSPTDQEIAPFLLTQNCLSATSSSRLNLSEFNLSNWQTEFNYQLVNIMPISVTTFDEDNDVRLIAVLDQLGVISILDPTKFNKITEFASTSSGDKFVHMSYCSGKFGL